MFFMEYILPALKVVFLFGNSHIIAIPFCICWNNLAPKYMDFLPEIYQRLPYWHIVGLMMIVGIIGHQIHRLCPEIVKVSQSNTNTKGEC